MKKLSRFFAIAALLILSGCFDTVQESTINDDGSGLFVSTMDMGKLLGMVKMVAGEKEGMKDMDKMKKDTTIYLKDIRDSIKNLSDAEKKLIDKASLKVIMNMPDEIFSMAFSFPYSQPADVATINNLLKKTKQNVMADQMEKFMGGDTSGTDEKKAMDNNLLLGDVKSDSSISEVDDYYKYEYKKGKISKKLNKEKYANVENDKTLASLKEMNQMGISSTMKTIFNLPRPAKKAEGKGVKLSTDRKKVTIEGSLDDFFEDASYFEYEIEY
ncbi:MAG TPA: hypothetical protein VFT15_02395 [Chitinophagaceae bacterium]|nr:hypothetical protein [Chitinophagaceae bacterium]